MCVILLELNPWYSTWDSMKYELSPFLVSVVGTKIMQAAQLCWGHQVPQSLARSPGIPQFSGYECEKDTVRFE